MFGRGQRIVLQLLNRARLPLSRRQESTALASASYHDLIQAFREPGCPICNLLLRDADRFLDSLLYQLALDDDTQRAFRARRGLCSEHSWLAVNYMGRALSIATLYAAVLEEVLQITDETPVEEPGRRRSIGPWARYDDKSSLLAERLDPAGPCVVCDLLTQTEQRYMATLREYVATPHVQEAYRLSDGLCLPHFRQALRAMPSPCDRALLTSFQKAIWRQLRTDVEEYIAKNNYLRIRETMGHEGDSWRRAVIRMGGEKGVFGPDPR